MVSFANYFFIFLSLALPCGLLVWLGSPVPKQPDQLCNDLVVMCYEIQIQIAGFIFSFLDPERDVQKEIGGKCRGVMKLSIGCVEMLSYISTN